MNRRGQGKKAQI